MADSALYKATLLDHFYHPHNKGDLKGADRVRRGSNPRCGDEVEVGIYLDGERIDRVRFRGRGCSICMASASMMTEAVSGMDTEETRRLCDLMQGWFGTGAGETSWALPESLEALNAARAYPARRRCVLLAWEALSAALAEP